MNLKGLEKLQITEKDMPYLKIGDEVICINNYMYIDDVDSSRSTRLILGKKYKILDISRDKIEIKDEIRVNSWFAKRFAWLGNPKMK